MGRSATALCIDIMYVRSRPAAIFMVPQFWSALIIIPRLKLLHDGYGMSQSGSVARTLIELAKVERRASGVSMP